MQIRQRTPTENTHIQYLFDDVNRMQKTAQVCVIVPVRNEAGHLYHTLEALRHQLDYQGQLLNPETYEVLVLINNSTDLSYQIAAAYAIDFPAFRLLVENIDLPDDQAHIGTVRRILMDKAYKRLTREKNSNGIIASTDGDTMVDSQWVYHIIAEIAKGNDAVGGRILTRKKTGSARLFHLRDVTYRCLLTQAESLVDPQAHNPFPCHFQYFGANMAVTSSMYEQAGRLPAIPFLEDAAFHKALIQQDARIRKSFKVKAYTSARTNGRVAIGFSEQLKKWEEEEKSAQKQMVEAVAPILMMYGLRNRLRKCWFTYQKEHVILQQELYDLASSLQISSDFLQTELIQTASFGLLWESMLQYINHTTAFQPIEQAIMQLRHFVHHTHLSASEKSPAGMSFHEG